MTDSRIEQLIGRGQGLVKQKKFRPAIIYFNQALALDPQAALAYYHRGHCWAGLKQWPRAELDFSRAMRLDPENPDPIYYLGLLLLQRGEQAKAAQCLERARGLGHPRAVHYLQSLARQPGSVLRGELPPTETRLLPGGPDVHKLFQQGLVLIRERRFERALAVFAQVLALDPERWSAYHKRGNIYYDLEQYELALAEYERAVSLAPNEPPLRYSRGRARHALGAHDEALRDYNFAFKNTDPARAPQTLALVLVDRARLLRQMNRLDEAWRDLEQARRIRPYSGQLAFEFGLHFLAQGNMKEAEARFQEAVSYDPKHGRAFCHLGLVHLHFGQPEAAIEDFTSAIELLPQEAEIYVERGIAHGRAGRTPEEVADFEQAITVQPDYPAAHFRLGESYFRRGQHERAIPYLNHCLALDADYQQAYAIRGAAYWKAGRLGEALQDYRKALRLNPEDQVTRLNVAKLLRDWRPADAPGLAARGVFQGQIGAFEQALVDLNKALAKDDSLLEVYRERGQVLMNLKAHEEAILDFSRVLYDRPDDVELLIQRSECYLSIGRFDRAQIDAQRACRLAPNEPAPRHALGQAHFKQGQYDKALTAYDQALALAGEKPEAALFHNSRGIVRQKLGDDGSALTDFQKAVALNPEVAQAHFNIGRVHERAGRPDEALGAFEKAAILGYGPAIEAFEELKARLTLAEEQVLADEAVSQEPENPAVYVQRARLYLRGGQTAEAQSDIRQALALDEGFGEALVVQALVHRRQDQLEQALAALNDALERNGAAAGAYKVEAYLIRGAIFRDENRYDEAAADFAMAGKLAPRDPQPRYELAILLRHSDRLEEAQPLLEEVIELDPDHAQAHFDLGHLYHQANQLEQALVHLKRAAALGYREANPTIEVLLQQLEAPVDEEKGEPQSLPPKESELVQFAVDVLTEFAEAMSGVAVEARTRKRRKMLGRPEQEVIEIVKWQVRAEEMAIFEQRGDFSAFPGATLELPWPPPALVRLSVIDDEWLLLMLMTSAEEEGGVEPAGFTTVLSQRLPADIDAVREALAGLVRSGYLVGVKNKSLRYTGKQPEE